VGSRPKTERSATSRTLTYGDTWTTRYLIVDMKNWWPGKRVPISTQWIERISLEESKVSINLIRGATKQGPEYTDQTLISYYS
jgi:hypothetical protein